MSYSILVAHSYFALLDPKQSKKMRPYPPLATLYVAADLRARGYEVTVFDSMLSQGEHEFEELVERVRPDAVVLYEDNFNFLSKMCLTRMREAALTMTEMAGDRDAWVIAAGSDVTDRPELYLRSGVDFAVLGEGDHTVHELVAWLAANATGNVRPIDAQAIAGLAVLDAERDVVRTERRANERHPDVFAYPARDLIDIERYRATWREHHGIFSLNIVSTRGCPFHCNWCAKPIWGQRYAMRSAVDVADEMATVKSSYAPDQVWFADDIFGLRPSWLVQFADAVIERDAVIPFTMQSRCDLMTPEAVAGLARAGCHEVWLGVESGSQRILDAMDKGTTLDDVRLARERLADAGIRACFFTQFGYPGEMWIDIMQTVRLLRETLPDDIGISVSYPLPGTKFHSMVVEQLQGMTNWEDSADLQMLFRGTYTTPFYRALHSVVHDDLNLHRRLAGLPHARHIDLPDVDMATHQQRVDTSWAELLELEASCRNSRPTLLVRTEPAPAAPDLAAAHNYSDH